MWVSTGELERDNGAAKALIPESVVHVQAANEELRELAHGILPADLADGGLRGGIDAVVERLDLDVTVDLPPGRFPAEIEASAYFVGSSGSTIGSPPSAGTSASRVTQAAEPC